MNMKRFLSLLLVNLFACMCILGQSATNMKKQKDKKTGENRYEISAELVRKEFVNKGGKKTARYEFFVRRSVQDYFIKICEGEVKRKYLEEIYASFGDTMIKMVNVEISFQEGMWDICEADTEVQSRVGPYAVLYSISK